MPCQIPEAAPRHCLSHVDGEQSTFWVVLPLQAKSHHTLCSAGHSSVCSPSTSFSSS